MFRHPILYWKQHLPEPFLIETVSSVRSGAFTCICLTLKTPATPCPSTTCSTWLLLLLAFLGFDLCGLTECHEHFPNLLPAARFKALLWCVWRYWKGSTVFFFLGTKICCSHGCCLKQHFRSTINSEVCSCVGWLVNAPRAERKYSYGLETTYFSYCYECLAKLPYTL